MFEKTAVSFLEAKNNLLHRLVNLETGEVGPEFIVWGRPASTRPNEIRPLYDTLLSLKDWKDKTNSECREFILSLGNCNSDSVGDPLGTIWTSELVNDYGEVIAELSRIRLRCDGGMELILYNKVY